jgi:hypothetical protein
MQQFLWFLLQIYPQMATHLVGLNQWDFWTVSEKVTLFLRLATDQDLE